MQVPISNNSASSIQIYQCLITCVLFYIYYNYAVSKRIAIILCHNSYKIFGPFTFVKNFFNHINNQQNRLQIHWTEWSRILVGIQFLLQSAISWNYYFVLFSALEVVSICPYKKNFIILVTHLCSLLNRYLYKYNY